MIKESQVYLKYHIKIGINLTEINNSIYLNKKEF